MDAYVSDLYAKRTEDLGEDITHRLATQVMLRVIDTRWMAYLQEMDYLKTGIGLRGFGQRDPLVEYKQEAYAAFGQLVDTMYEDFLRTMLHIRRNTAPVAAATPAPSALDGVNYSGPAEVDGAEGTRGSVFSRARANVRPAQGAHAERREANAPSPKASEAKPHTYRKADDPDPYVGVGRNDPCPCGSGKKFKNCHGRNR